MNLSDMEWNACKTFITSRIEVSLQRLKDNQEYQKRCHKQDVSGKLVDELLHKLDNDERATIRRYYEEQLAKENLELDSVYIQGAKDCLHLLTYLDAFHAEVCK